jgi:hypothetical protein
MDAHMGVRSVKIDDRTQQAMTALKAAGYNPSEIMRRQVVRFAVDNGLIPDDKTDDKTENKKGEQNGK